MDERLHLHQTIYEKLMQLDYKKYTLSQLRSLSRVIQDNQKYLSSFYDLLSPTMEIVEMKEKYNDLQCRIEKQIEEFLCLQGIISNYTMFSKFLRRFQPG